MNFLRIICRAFIDLLAHSIRFLPRSASSMFLMSQLIAAVDMLLLFFMFSFFASLQCVVARRKREKNLDVHGLRKTRARTYFLRIHQKFDTGNVSNLCARVRFWDYSRITPESQPQILTLMIPQLSSFRAGTAVSRALPDFLIPNITCVPQLVHANRHRWPVSPLCRLLPR